MARLQRKTIKGLLALVITSTLAFLTFLHTSQDFTDDISSSHIVVRGRRLEVAVGHFREVKRVALFEESEQEMVADEAVGGQGHARVSGRETDQRTNDGDKHPNVLPNVLLDLRNDKQQQSDDSDSIQDDLLNNINKHDSVKQELHKNDGPVQTPYCDQECQDFKQYMTSWPPDRPKAAFYYLTQSSRWSYFNESLQTIDKYFNDYYNYPVIVFHEREFTQHRERVRGATKSKVFFQEVEFVVPGFLQAPVPANIPCLSEISYRHMCRFHAKTVFEEPIVQDLEYYWRLDDDSLLLSNVTYDVFHFMQINSLQYGYLWRHLDAYSCTEGLWEATEAYLISNNMSTNNFKKWKRPWLFYNNFEISKMELWLSPHYRSYIDYIDKQGGIFYHRWGDAPIKGLAVAIFIPRSQRHYFQDIGYQHRTFINNATVH